MAHPFRIDDNDPELKVNMDWSFASSGGGSKKDRLDFFCSRDFAPKKDGEPYYIADDLADEPLDDRITEGVKTVDFYGISVNSQVINREDKVAHLVFMRPIKAIHPQDLEIVQGQTYNIFVSYGIFPGSDEEPKTD